MVTVTLALGPLTTQARLLVPLPRGSEPPLHVGGAGPGRAGAARQSVRPVPGSGANTRGKRALEPLGQGF